MLDRRSFITLTAAFSLGACARAGSVAMRPGSRLIVLRHADRDGEELNKAGRARAAALVGALKGVSIDAIYAPSIKRNLDTAAPLAKARGLAVTPVAANNPASRLAQLGAGKTVVWVGNKTNLDSIWQELALPDPAPLDYGDLFIVETDQDGTTRVKRGHFGAKVKE